MENYEIDRLLVEISNGSVTAFEELYIKTRKGVFSFIYTYLQNYHDTEDAMQAVYLKIKQNIHSYAKGSNGRAWLLQIAKNYALDELRKRKQHIFSTIYSTHDHAVIEDGSIMDIMQKTLDVDELRIVTLHVLWKYKHKEIAKMLDCPTGTITSKYKRALDKMKKAIKEVW